MNKGIIAINKPQNWTSFDVVNKIKHMVRPVKVGHLGTLDPMATGILLVTVGSATKLFDIMQTKSKTYVAKFKFGLETDTLDATGETLKLTEILPTLQQIEKVLPKFIGKISQIPPKYSAKSINGKRAYELARNNLEFELQPKVVEIYSIEILSYNDGELSLKIKCGSGTYIRSIGRDLAYELNTLATMTELVRTEIDNFTLDGCKNINNINKENLTANTTKITDVLCLPTININSEMQKKILNGQIVKTTLNDGLYKLNDEFDTIALINVKDFNAKMSVFLQ